MPIFGIDVSGATVDWATVKASGIAFGIAKATEGNGYTQPQIAANLKGMRAAGIVPGAYHFLVSDFAGATGEAQCDYFLAHVGDPTDLIVALDVEVEPNLPQQPGIREVRAWVSRFKSRYPNHPVLVYSGAWYWKSAHYMNDPAGSDLGPLWDSKYVYDAGSKYKAPAVIYGSVPTTWWTPGYGGWTGTSVLQFTAWPTVPGVSGSCDASAYLGSVDELKRQLINPTLPTTATGADMTNLTVLQTFEAGRLLNFLAAGTYTGYHLDGTTKQMTLGGPSWAHVGPKVVITQDPQRSPNGTFFYVMDGGLGGCFVPIAAANVALGDPIVADCSAQVAAAVAPLQAQIAGLKTQLNDVNAQIGALNQQVTALKADIAKKDAYIAAFPKG